MITGRDRSRLVSGASAEVVIDGTLPIWSCWIFVAGVDWFFSVILNFNPRALKVDQAVDFLCIWPKKVGENVKTSKPRNKTNGNQTLINI